MTYLLIHPSMIAYSCTAQPGWQMFTLCCVTASKQAVITDTIAAPTQLVHPSYRYSQHLPPLIRCSDIGSSYTLPHAWQLNLSWNASFFLFTIDDFSGIDGLYISSFLSFSRIFFAVLSPFQSQYATLFPPFPVAHSCKLKSIFLIIMLRFFFEVL